MRSKRQTDPSSGAPTHSEIEKERKKIVTGCQVLWGDQDSSVHSSGNRPVPPAGREALGWRVSPGPTEKPAGTALHAGQGQAVPCSPLSPTLPLLWRVLQTSNVHRGETGSETMWHCRGELWHCQPAGPRPVPACLQAAPVHQHPSEPGPLTCVRPDTWQQLWQRGAALPRARHRAAAHGWREHRALGHPRHPAPAAGPGLPTASPAAPTPLPPRRGGAGTVGHMAIAPRVDNVAQRLF